MAYPMPAPRAVPPVRVSRGIPIWVHGICWVLVLLASAALGAFLLLAAAFSCDSGWSGCAELGNAAMVTYAVATLVVATAALVVPAFSSRTSRYGRVIRIVGLVLIPCAPVLGIVASVIVYTVGYQANGY